MAVKIKETPTRLMLSGDVTELNSLDKHFSFHPDRYWMSDAYQIYRRHYAQIKAARQAGNENLAQNLEQRKVGWDGWKHPLRVKVTQAGATGVVARGHLDDLLQFAGDVGIQVDTTELLKNPFAGITIEDIPDDLLAVELNQEQWEIQKRCILAWLAHGIARNKVTVSGGKTAMFCAAAAMVKRRFPNARFLYFTPTERLSKQVYTEAQKFLPDWHITKFGGGTDRDDTGKDMVVCSVALLNKRFKQLLDSGWLRSFMCLLMDENQRAASPSMSKVILASSAYFRFAASDTTCEDNLEKSLTLTGLCGPIYERVEAIELIKLDRIAIPTIEVIESNWWGKFDHLGHEPEVDTPAWVLIDGEWKSGVYKGHVYELDENGNYKYNRRKEPITVPGVHQIEIDGKYYQVESRWCLLARRYDQAIITFKERNQIIAERAADSSRRGLATLIIATRTLHVMILQSVVSKLAGDDKVRVLYSVHSPDERDEAFEWLKTTPGAVLISPLVKVGVSINEIAVGIVADYVAGVEVMNQMVGRMIRRKPDGTPNEAEVTIFADNQHSSYAKASQKMIAKLQEIEGYRWKLTKLT